MHCRRILIDKQPFASRPRIDFQVPWNALEHWPCKWVNLEIDSDSALVAFRCRLELNFERHVRLHVTADESYDLWIDGELSGSGPERGDRRNWFFDTYDIVLESGIHQISAVVKQLGPLRAVGSVTVSHGLLVVTEDLDLLPLLGTGCGPWEAAELPGFQFKLLRASPGDCFLIGPAYQIDYRLLSPSYLTDATLNWSQAQSGQAGVAESALHPVLAKHMLRPAFLPSQKRIRRPFWRARRVIGDIATGEWESLAAGDSIVRLKPDRTYEVLLDSEDYLCAFLEFDIEGGRAATFETVWAEVIRDSSGKKNNRGDVNGPVLGLTDSFIADGSRRTVRTPTWRSGRYLQVRIITQSQQLILHKLAIFDTGYPINSQALWASGDEDLDRVLKVCLRTQEACAQETFIDCPYYEQLQYVGDTRIQALITYCLTADSRLARKAIELFLSSAMNPSGLPLAFAPGDGGSLIPPFALWLVSMVRDYAWWRDDFDRVRSWLPSLRGVIDIFLSMPKTDGLFRSPFGWNFLDGALGSMAPGGMPGDVSGPVNWQIVIALKDLADLEEAFGEPELKARFIRHAQELTASLDRSLFRSEMGLYSDVPSRDQFSQHGQILPLLSGMLSPARHQQIADGLLTATFEKSAGAFFRFYLFEIFFSLGRAELICEQLESWKWAISQGFTAFPEYIQSDTRSDCHAWSAHPFFHFYGSILGIRPANWGFNEVRISPQPGSMTSLSGTMAHGSGLIRVALTIDGNHFAADVELPDSLTGTFCFHNRVHRLCGGHSKITDKTRAE